MTKKLTKEAQIVALTETNASLVADVASLSEAIGEMEGEIIAAKGEALDAKREAEGKVFEALATASGQAADMIRDRLENLRDETTRLIAERDQAERVRDEWEAAMEKMGAEHRKEVDEWETRHDDLIEAHKEEIDGLDEKHGKELDEARDELTNDAALERDTALDALRDYLADLGFSSDVHPSNISCPALRRLVQAAL